MKSISKNEKFSPLLNPLLKLNNKASRIGRNPKTKEEFYISSRNVITFKASKILLKYINNKISD